MIMLLPVVGWLIAFVFMFFLSIPFYWLWNTLAPVYFYWLPKVYLELPFMDCVWLMMLITILKLVLLPNFSSTIKTGSK
jgi:hypothetical protein